MNYLCDETQNDRTHVSNKLRKRKKKFSAVITLLTLVLSLTLVFSAGCGNGKITDGKMVETQDAQYYETAIECLLVKYKGTATEFAIPEKVTAIGDEAFINIFTLQSVIIGENVKKIGEKAFLNCNKLTSVLFPRKLESIGKYAFSNCSKLSSITLPDSLTKIEGNTFEWCGALSYANLGNGIKVIGYNAFYMSGLVSITIPENVTRLETAVFLGCDKLSSVSFANPNGWFITTDAKGESGTSISLSKTPATLATYVRRTYKDYYWNRV